MTAGSANPHFHAIGHTVRAGRFVGPLAVPIRPFVVDAVETLKRITGRFSRVHGEPLHVGEPAALRIAGIAKPDFGEVLTPMPGGTPVFWGCGLTALTALEQSGVPLFITHAARAMLVGLYPVRLTPA